MQTATRLAPTLVALALSALQPDHAPAQIGGGSSEGISGQTASVRQHNGVPTLFTDGQPHSGMAFASYAAEASVFRDFAKVGVDLFSFVATPTGLAYHTHYDLDVWVSPDEFDYTPFDDRVGRVLEANRKAMIFPRLSLSAPKWWLDRHPDDIALGIDADGRMAPIVDGGKLAPSWASDAWRRDTIGGLVRLIKHIEGSDYADRIIGYHLVSGTTEEWMAWGANNDIWGDYSPVNVKRFRLWLRDKYRTEDPLKAAWHDTEVGFDTAQIPSRDARQATRLGTLRRPAEEQAVIDFYLYNSDLVAETIGLLAREVKDATGRRKTVGVFYGYIMQLDGEHRLQNAGHLALHKVLECPDVDFLSSPTSYKYRLLGGAGTSHYMAPLGSVQLHGKLWFNENDIRTSITPRLRPGQWGKPENIQGDILQHEKELAGALTNGAAQWWFDVGGIRHDDPTLLARYGRFVEDAESVLRVDRTPLNEIAFVVDDTSSVYMRVGDPLSGELVCRQLPDLHRVGAPVGHYLAADLDQLDDHKLIILANCFAPSGRQRAAIEKLKSNGRWLVFHYAAGLYADGRLAPESMQSFTGVRVKLDETPLPLQVTLASMPAMPSRLHGSTYGTPRPVTPVFVPDDPEAEVFGTLPDGRPGLVVRHFDDWTAVYSAAPILPRNLLTFLSEKASVHRYIDTPDVVWANRSMLTVSVDKPGRRSINFPAARNVLDLYGEKELARGVREFTADFADKQTRVFLLTQP